MMGLDSGTTIFARMVKWEAPSRRADSIRLSGIEPWKLFFMINRLYGAKHSGKIRHQMVSSMCSWFISR